MKFKNAFAVLVSSQLLVVCSAFADPIGDSCQILAAAARARGTSQATVMLPQLTATQAPVGYHESFMYGPAALPDIMADIGRLLTEPVKRLAQGIAELRDQLRAVEAQLLQNNSVQRNSDLQVRKAQLQGLIWSNADQIKKEMGPHNGNYESGYRNYSLDFDSLKYEVCTTDLSVHDAPALRVCGSISLTTGQINYQVSRYRPASFFEAFGSEGAYRGLVDSNAPPALFVSLGYIAPAQAAANPGIRAAVFAAFQADQLRQLPAICQQPPRPSPTAQIIDQRDAHGGGSVPAAGDAGPAVGPATQTSAAH